MRQPGHYFLVPVFCFFLCACGGSNHVAPVYDVADLRSSVKPRVIITRVPSEPAIVAEAARERVAVFAEEQRTPAPVFITNVFPGRQMDTSDWMWPAHGKVIQSFSSTNKGIDIASTLGEPVYAAAPGKVVYSGNGLRAYGNLVIIKHDHSYMSTYAHNSQLLVKEGQWVKKGQKIAEMGNTGSDKVMLHFEIRKQGKPINPISLYQSS